LIGRPETSASPQTDHVVRFRAVKTTDQSADVPNDFDLKDYLGNAWGVYSGNQRYEIAIRFSRPAASVVTETRWHKTQTVEHHFDKSVTIKFIHGLDEIIWWLKSWAPFARVEQPGELRLRLVSELKAAIQLNS
jgi:predicted DNA-binding transcriptional regulator YafY